MDSRGIEREFLRAVRRFGKVNMGNLFEGISHGEFSVMVALERYAMCYDGEGASASVLASLVDSSPQALSRTLKSLEKKRLIERRVAPRDRRNAYICLTPEANDVMDAGKARVEELFQNVVDEMGEAEVRQLIDLLNRLVDTLHQISGQEETKDCLDEEDCCMRKEQKGEKRCLEY